MDKPRKQRSDKGKKRTDAPLPIHVQAWLSQDKNRPRDKSAVFIYKQMIETMTVHDAVREAFIAYGEMTKKGWQGAPTEMTLNNHLQESIQQMMTLVERLNSIDFSAANVEQTRTAMQEVQRDMGAFALNTRNLMSAVVFSEDDE